MPARLRLYADGSTISKPDSTTAILPAGLHLHHALMPQPASPAPDTAAESSRKAHWVEGNLDGARPVPWWRAPGIVLAAAAGGRSGARVWCVRAHSSEDAAVAQLYLALPQPPQPKAAFLVQGGDILLVTQDGGTLQPKLLRPAAVLTVLRREWLLSLFLFGPILGVFLVNLIFGMPSFLWWSALGVLILSLAVMASLIRNDLKELRTWVRRQRRLADAALQASEHSPTAH